MKNPYHALLMLIAGATQKELAAHIRYLKIELEIARAKLPKRVTFTPQERNRLIKFGAKLGRALDKLVTIVHPDTLRRWIRESKKPAKKEPAKRGRRRTAEDIRKLIIKLAKENEWGYTRILGELRKLSIKSVSRNTVKKILKENGLDPGPQPWLSLLIDYYNRMVVGFCLGFEPPSYAVIMEALRHAILPKSYLRERYPRVQGTWPCFGLPEKLVSDRGPDLTSKDLEDAAFQLGIELDFNPPRTPHFKGTVWSFFDGLNDQLASALPGRTFRSWVERADYRPDDGPLITYEALLEVIHIHLVDVYAASKHPTARRRHVAVHSVLRRSGESVERRSQLGAD